MVEFDTEDYVKLKTEYDKLKNDFDIISEKVQQYETDIKAKDGKIANMSNMLYESMITREQPKEVRKTEVRSFDDLLREALEDKNKK